MKKITCLLWLLCFTTLYAKASKSDLIDGYYLTNDRDTVRCKIKVPKMSHEAFDLFEKVSILDSSGKEITYKANKHQIKGFGFVFGVEAFNYNLWTVNKDDEFVWRMTTGKKLNLYLYYAYVTMGFGTPSRRMDVYIIEDGNKKSLAISAEGLFGSIKKDIKKFFAGDDAMVKLVDDEVSNLDDIPMFVNAANRL